MDEKQIVKQLQELRKIRPSEDWVVFTKQTILKEKSQKNPQSGFSFAFRPIFALATLVFLVIVFAGAVFVLSEQKPAVISYENLQNILSRVVYQDKNKEQMNVSLAEIQRSLNDVETSLENLKNTENQREALALTGVVKATAQKSAEIIANIRNSNRGLSKKVLASLNNIADTSKDLEEKSDAVKETLLGNLIAELKQKLLNQEDQERLTIAEQYYQEGKNEEAMILIMRIGNNY